MLLGTGEVVAWALLLVMEMCGGAGGFRSLVFSVSMFSNGLSVRALKEWILVFVVLGLRVYSPLENEAVAIGFFFTLLMMYATYGKKITAPYFFASVCTESKFSLICGAAMVLGIDRDPFLVGILSVPVCVIRGLWLDAVLVVNLSVSIFMEGL